MRAETPGRHVVLYDGVCAFCDWMVRFVHVRDPVGAFRFEPLQGAWARETLQRHGRDPGALDTFVVVRDAWGPRESVLVRGGAAIFLLARLRFPWRLLSGIALLPLPLVDRVYDAFARVRYRLFGRLDACPVPPATPG